MTNADAERALARLHALINQMTEGLVLFDPEGHLIDMNPAALRIHGFESVEPLRRHIGDLADVFAVYDLAGRLLSTDEWPIGRVLRGETFDSYEVRVRRVDTGRTWIGSYGGAPVYGDDGRMILAIVTLRDVTEQHETLAALRESEARFRAVLENSLDAAYRRDLLRDRYEYMSPVIERICGFTAEEMMSMPLDEVLERIHPNDRAGIAVALDHAAEAGTGKFDYRFRCKDGGYRWIADSVTVTKDASGRAVYRSGILRDITEHKAVEERLKSFNEELERGIAERTAQLQALAMALTQAEERERRRVAGVLHDHLQQVLVAAKMNMGFLRMSTREGTEAAVAAENVDALLREAIQSSRSLTYELSPPILHQAGLTPALEWLARDMREKHGLHVEIEGGVTPGSVPEPLRVFLFRSVRELLFNVVKHADTDRARVSVEPVGGYLRVSVADAGRGFDGTVPYATAGESFGLLSIRERAGFFGGRMEVESAPARGTRVTVSVPLVPVLKAAAPHGAASSAEASAWAQGARLRVLIADDHKVMRTGLVSLLSREPDIEVVGEADDGCQAIEAARRLRPDVVVMDVSMPRMDGIEATRRLHDEMPRVRVVGLSLFEESYIANTMLEAGASAYLSKSGPSESLLAAIRAAARARQADDCDDTDGHD